MTSDPEPKPAIAPAIEPPEEPVPRIPRGRGLKLSWSQILRIALTAGMLVMLIVMQKPCADAVSKFVTGFGEDGSGSAASALPKPGTIGLTPATPAGSGSAYEHLGAEMTEAQIKAAVDRARAKATPAPTP